MQWPRTLRLPNVFSRLLPKRRPHVFAVLFFAILVTVGLSVWIQPTQAILVEIANGMIQFVSWIILALSSLFIKITIFFLELFILIAGYNNYINAPVVLLGWNMVRDVANMFFVVVLLVIAFGTILGLEQYEWRKSLAKLVFAAVFVNFSNLICQVMIDVAQVFTTTFLNAIVGTAGGNLINMFNFQEIYKISTGQDYQNFATPDSLMLDVFIAAVIALVFAGTAMWTIGAYLIVMIARMVVLWTLIILSPLGFILSVLPQTKSYADEFWSQFTHHVVVAPVMVFFLWLAFATFGGGNVVENAIEGPDNNSTNKTISNTVDQEGNPVSAGLSQAATYDRMANFVIAVAFLWIGIEQVQKLGVRAGGMTQGAMDFGKKLATVASGYAAGRYIAGKTKDAAWSGIKKGAYYAPFIGGEKWVNRAKITGGQIKGWYYGKGGELTGKGAELSKELQDLHRQQQEMTDEGQQGLRDDIQSKDARMETLKVIIDDKEGKHTDEEKEKAKASMGELEKEKTELQTKLANANVAPEKRKQEIAASIKEKEAALTKEAGGGIIGKIVRSGVALEKQAGKVEKQAENRKKLIFKQTSSEGQVGLPFTGKIGMGGKGIGFGKEFGKGEKGGRFRFFGDINADINAQDRIEEGWLQAEEARSKAKDFDIQTQGRLARLDMPRLKAKDGKFNVEAKYGSVSDQIENHNYRGEGYENEIQIAKVKSREKMLEKSMRVLESVKNDKEVSKLKSAMDALNRRIVGLNKIVPALQSATANKTEMEKAVAEGRDPHEIEKLKKAFEEAMKDANAVKDKYGVDLNLEDIDHAIEQGQKEMHDIPHDMEHLSHEYQEIFEKKIMEKAGGRNEIPAWNTARLEAKKHHAEMFYKGKQTRMTDDAAQKHIWAHEGITTPSTAMLDIVDHLMTEFKDMNYEGAVAAIAGHNGHIQGKKAAALKEGKTYEPTFDEVAISTALLQKLHGGSWVDDGIQPFRGIQDKFVEEFGDVGKSMMASLRHRQELQRMNPTASRAAGGSSARNFSTRDLQNLGNVLKQFIPDGQHLIEALEHGNSGAEADLAKAIEGKLSEGFGNLNPSDLRSVGLPVDRSQLKQALASLVTSMKGEDLRKLKDHI